MALTPFLMFIGEAEEAVRFYTSTFPDAEILNIDRNPPDDQAALAPSRVPPSGSPI